MGSYYDPAHGQTIGWNGNFYDATMSTPVNHLSGDYTRGQIFNNPGAVNDTYPHSGISPFYGNSFVNGNISKMLIWDDPTNFAGAKSYRFGSYMGKAYSILGNDYLSRVRNCSWRVVPRIGNEYGDGIGATEPTTVKNNSFTLEVMFDKPILHIDTPFAKTNFSSTVDGNPCYPYQYLTVSGQAMVRYSDATNTVFDGPTEVILNDEIGGGLYALNDPLDGGYVAYILQPGDPGYDPLVQHGLIVIPPDNGSGYAPSWSASNTTVSTSNLIGQGQTNTNNIIAQFGFIGLNPQSAAALVNSAVYFPPGGGYLPSLDELAGILANANAGLIPSYPSWGGEYWSSSQSGSSLAWTVNLSGPQVATPKTSGVGVIKAIAVKSF
jgi:hypothetical protein